MGGEFLPMALLLDVPTRSQNAALPSKEAKQKPAREVAAKEVDHDPLPRLAQGWTAFWLLVETSSSRGEWGGEFTPPPPHHLPAAAWTGNNEKAGAGGWIPPSDPAVWHFNQEPARGTTVSIPCLQRLPGGCFKMSGGRRAHTI